MENDNTTKYVLIGAGIFVGYFGVLKPILEKIGVLKSADEIKNDAAEIQGNGWSPVFWNSSQAPDGTFVITYSAANTMAESIYNSFGVISDNYNQILGVLKKLRTKSQVSYLCYIFQQKYNMDLYAFLRDGGGLPVPPFTWWDGLSSDNLTKLNAFVDSLPNFKA